MRRVLRGNTIFDYLCQLIKIFFLFMKKKRLIYFLALLAVLIIFLLRVFSPGLFKISQDENAEIPHEVSPSKYAYGINIDSCILETDHVKRNESMSDILSSYGIHNGVIHELAILSRQEFDVRKIRAGNKYALILANDSLQSPQYFIYEIDPTDYVVYDLKDSLQVYRGTKPVEKVIRTASGIIESSLWNAMIDNGTDPNLANELSEIYAWTIDFFGIQKGDYYQVIYEDQMVEGESIGLGNVLAANFNHYDSDNYAFYFYQNEDWDYFDEEAQSLQRTFLKAPLRFRRISSKFSYSRMHPVLKIRRPHTGVDYAAATGTPVYTIGDGRVIEKGYDRKGGGNYIKIKHNGTYTTVYMHLQGFAKGLTTGKQLKQGDLIGYVGSTGLSTGPHLDFRVYRNGKPIDPLKMESPPAKPVDTAYLDQFHHFKDSLLVEIGDIQVLKFSEPVVSN
jgi:murein DD-endopeptidase MepM/ murein hydrolase activator NlpD